MTQRFPLPLLQISSTKWRAGGGEIHCQRGRFPAPVLSHPHSATHFRPSTQQPFPPALFILEDQYSGSRLTLKPERCRFFPIVSKKSPLDEHLFGDISLYVFGKICPFSCIWVFIFTLSIWTNLCKCGYQRDYVCMTMKKQ